MRIYLYLSVLAAATLTLSAAPIDWSHPPSGWKPVFLKNPDGSWVQALVPDDSQSRTPSVTPPAATGTTAQNSTDVDANGTATEQASTAAYGSARTTAQTSSLSPASGSAGESEPDKALNTALAGLDWKRELNAIPAFTALDVTPETVARPTTPRDLAASLLSGVDRKGVLQSGLALETAPYQVFFGHATSLEDYRTNYLTRLLYRSSISLATIKAGSGSDDKAQRLALGLSITLFDAADPYLNTEIDELHDRILEDYGAPTAADLAQGMRPTMTDAELRQAVTSNEKVKKWEANKAEANAKFISELKEIRDKRWGTSAWNVAAAPAWLSESGNADDLHWDGFSAWSTFAYGFENVAPLQNKMQVFAHLRYREGEHLVDTDDSTITANQNSFLAAASLRLHFPKQELNLAAEAAYIRIWNGLNGDGDAKRIGGVIEKKITENAWLVLSIGQDFGGGGKENELFALSALRFGTADKARFAP